MSEETEDKDDGGNAFPAMLPGGNYCTTGMSLRDWFAGQVLAAIISHPGMEPDDCHRDGCASLAYEFSDAMLKARVII